MSGSRELVISKNNLFFLFLLLGYLFGVILYDFLGFNYTDELMALFLAGFAISVIWERKIWKGLLPLIVILSIGIFYIIYSFIIRSNVPEGSFAIPSYSENEPSVLLMTFTVKSCGREPSVPDMFMSSLCIPCLNCT